MTRLALALVLLTSCDVAVGNDDGAFQAEGEFTAEGTVTLEGHAVLDININWDDGLDDCELDFLRFAQWVTLRNVTGVSICYDAPRPAECVLPKVGCGTYVNETVHSDGHASWCVGVDVSLCPL